MTCKVIDFMSQLQLNQIDQNINMLPLQYYGKEKRTFKYKIMDSDQR